LEFAAGLAGSAAGAGFPADFGCDGGNGSPKLQAWLRAVHHYELKRCAALHATRTFCLMLKESLVAIKTRTVCPDFARVLMPVRAMARHVAPEYSISSFYGILEKWRISADLNGGRYWD
jgi:hypothetical protein